MVVGSPEPSSAGLQASFSGQQLWHNSFEPKNHEEPLGKGAVSYAFTITASLDKSSMMGSLSSSFNPFNSIDNTMASPAGLHGQRWWRRPFLLWDCSGYGLPPRCSSLDCSGIYSSPQPPCRWLLSTQHHPVPRARDSEALRRPQPRPLQVTWAGRRGMKDIFNLHQSLAMSIQRNCLTFLCE